jgi:AAA lid domain
MGNRLPHPGRCLTIALLAVALIGTDLLLGAVQVQKRTCGPPPRAIFSGRFNVTCDDIRTLALPVMRHRLFTNFNADAEGLTPEDIIRRLLDEVPEPPPEDYVGSGGETG